MARPRIEGTLRVSDKGTATVKAFGRTAKREARTAGGAFQRVDRSMAGVSKTAGALRSQMGGLFAGLSAALVVRDLAKTVAGYEQAMATVQGVTKATGAQFEALQAKARQLGATTRFSAQEAAEAELFLARAGFSANQVLAATPATLNLAAAGAIALGEAADYASNIVSQFNLAAAETGRVTDVLVSTSNSANTNVSQLAQALKFAGPVAGAVGQSLEMTAAAAGVLGDSGIQASLAGTNLRGVMAALLRPTAEGEKIIRQMAGSLDAVNPATKSLVDIFEVFRRSNLTAAQAVEIFGRRNAAAALVLTANVGKMRTLTAANEAARGEAQRMAAVMNDTLAGSFKALRSAIEELYLATGDEGLAGNLRAIVDTMTEATRILAGFEGAVENASTAGKRLAEIVDLLTVGMKMFVAVKAAKYISILVKGLIGLRAAAAANPLGAMVAGAVVLVEVFRRINDSIYETDKLLSRQSKSYRKVREEIEATAEATNLLQEAAERGNRAAKIKLLEKEREGLAKYITLLHEAQGMYTSGSQAKKTLGVDFVGGLGDTTKLDEKMATIEGIRKRLHGLLSRGPFTGRIEIPEFTQFDPSIFTHFYAEIKKARSEAGETAGAWATEIPDTRALVKRQREIVEDTVQRLRDAAVEVPRDIVIDVAKDIYESQGQALRKLKLEALDLGADDAKKQNKVAASITGAGWAVEKSVASYEQHAAALRKDRDALRAAEIAAAAHAQAMMMEPITGAAWVASVQLRTNIALQLCEAYKKATEAEEARQEAEQGASQMLGELQARVHYLELVKAVGEDEATATIALEQFKALAMASGNQALIKRIALYEELLKQERDLSKQPEQKKRLTREEAKERDPSRAGGFGFAAGEYADAVQDAFATGERLAAGTAQAMARSFESLFFAVIEGRFDQLAAHVAMEFARVGIGEVAQQLSAQVMALFGAQTATATTTVTSAATAATILTTAGATLGAQMIAGATVAAAILTAAQGAGAVAGAAGGGIGGVVGMVPMAARGAVVGPGGVDAFASGGVFASRHLKAFASGGVPETASRYRGIVDQATLFAMAGNRFGVMGEAGPEALMPAERHGAGYAIHAEFPGGRKALLELGRLAGGILGVRLGTRAGAPMGPAQPYASGAVFDAGMATATGRAYSEPVVAGSGGAPAIQIHNHITINNPKDGKDVQAGLDKALPKLRKEIERTAKRVFQRQRINERSRSMIAAMSRSR